MMTTQRDPLAESFRAALDLESAEDTSRDDAALLARAIDRAMASAAAPVAPVVVPPAAASTGSLRALSSARSARVRMLRYALPAAAALVASIAMAAVYIQYRSSPSPDMTHAPQERTAPAERPLASPSPAPPAASEAAPTISVMDLPSAAPSGSAYAARPGPHSAPLASASELFRDANASRRAGEVDKAVELYGALVSQFPDTPEAHAARVSLGRLLLDRRGDAAGALAQFDAYLKASSSDRALAEEARLGRALVFQRQGRQEEERRAWDELLERHPDSLYASRARERLHALAPSSPAP
jgi:tetratricopeptide (TPR) repeat protein